METSPTKSVPAKPTSARAVHIIDRPGAPQSTVIMGMPTVDPSNADFIPLTVMDALLGGAFASRVTKNIREDKGYSYSPYSTLDVRRNGGNTLAVVDVRNEVTGATLGDAAYRRLVANAVDWVAPIS